MKRKTIFAAIAAAGAIAVVVALPGGEANAPAPPTHPALHTVAQPGYIANLDPKTGKVSTQPVATSPGLLEGLNTSSQGLTEVPSPVAGGGTMVELKGRFRNFAEATIDKSGALKTECTTHPKAPAATGEGGER